MDSAKLDCIVLDDGELDDGLRWDVSGTDDMMIYASGLNTSAAKQYILELRKQGLDCFMELSAYA